MRTSAISVAVTSTHQDKLLFNQVAPTGIFNVANMTSTSFDGPVDMFSKLGFVPEGESTWNVTLGVFQAAGGLFSDTIDMISFTESIITNKFLSPKKTRDWMKPATHTSSLGISVGAPWEVLRSNTLTEDKRLIDIYTKSGDFGLCHALIAPVNGRMYPVDINSDAPFGRNPARSIQHRCSTFTMWRAYFDTTSDEKNAAKDDALFYTDGSWETWVNFDQTSYDYLSLGEFVFVHDAQGSVTAVNSLAFDVTFDKVK